MTEEETTLDENAKATLDENADSEDTTNFDDLFSEESDDSDAQVTREEYENLKKGAQKLATELGMLKKQGKTEVKSEAPVAKAVEVDDMTEFFLEQTPKAELVKDKLTQVAKALYGGSIIKAWRGESWIREVADKQFAEKTEEETNKTKIDRPSNDSVSNKKVDISKVKAEDVAALTPSQKNEWVKAQAHSERNIID